MLKVFDNTRSHWNQASEFRRTVEDLFDYLAGLLRARGMQLDPCQKRSTFLAFFAKDMAQKVLRDEDDKITVTRLNSSFY